MLSPHQMCADVHSQWYDLIDVSAHQLLHHIRQIIVFCFSDHRQQFCRKTNKAMTFIT